MVDERTLGFPEPLIDQDGVQNGTTETKIYNRRISHTATATIDKDRFTSLDTLDIRPDRK